MRSLRGRVLFLPAIFVTQCTYVGTVWWVAPLLRSRGPHAPFVASIGLTYAAVFLVVYLFMRLAYWERLSHVDDGHGIRLFGLQPASLLRRTGCRLVDPVGLAASLLLALACALTPACQVVFPLPALCVLAFLGGLLLGESGPWPSRRRGTS